jgi:hypothetical protein
MNSLTTLVFLPGALSRVLCTRGDVVLSTPPNDPTDDRRFFLPALPRVLSTRGDVVLSTLPNDLSDELRFFWFTSVLQGTVHAGRCRVEHTP